MKASTIPIVISSVIILFVGYPFGCMAQKEDPEYDADSLSDTIEAVIPSDKELENSLTEVGADISKMILNKDALGLLKYVQKGDNSVSYFPDVYKSYEEVRADLVDTTGEKYCQLFDISCYRDSDIVASVHEIFLEGSAKNMKVEASVFHDKTYPDFVYGAIHYDWEGMPEAYKKEPLTTNYFVWTKEGWMFDTFFSWY